MYVASQEGTTELDFEFSDPCLCTYKAEGALEPAEIKAHHPSSVRDRQTFIFNKRK